MSGTERSRLVWLGVFVAVLATAVAVRLHQLQVSRAAELRARADDQYHSRLVIPATRGAIVDRGGDLLAVSMETSSLYARPQRVEHADRAATLLAPVLGMQRRELLERLRSKRPFVFLKRFLEPDDALRVRALGLPLGDSAPFGFEREPKRVYPRGKLAAHVLGYATVDGEGVEGIEQRFDDVLRGDPTVYLVLQDAHAGRLREPLNEPRRHPHDVLLTLDTALQHLVERELDLAMRETGSQAASAVLLEPATGEILALANRPAPDPNFFGRASQHERMNRAVVSVYEPGSTFKIVGMAAALDRDRVRPGQRIWCENGTLLTRGRPIRDVARHGSLTLEEVLEKSSNIGIVKVVRTVSAREFWDSIRRFGFGLKTGVELPGESRGLVRDVAKWSGFSQDSLAFGQEIGVTALQMAAAFAAVANDGWLVPPHVVYGTRDADGRVTPAPHESPRRVVRSSTAREIGRMLEGVVSAGTGKRGTVAGYRVAGKSGTAQRASEQGGYLPGEYVASFGAFAPVSAPRIVALVVLHSPHGRQHQGGQVAAPVCGRILTEALRYLRVPPDAPDDETDPPAEVGNLLAGLRKPAETTWATRRPVEAAEPGTMPDVLGAGVREAVVALARQGCRPVVVGSGVVATQDPVPGTVLAAGQICTLRLEEGPVAAAPAEASAPRNDRADG